MSSHYKFMKTFKAPNIPRNVSLRILTKCKCETEELSCFTHVKTKCKSHWPLVSFVFNTMRIIRYCGRDGNVRRKKFRALEGGSYFLLGHRMQLLSSDARPV